jgi:hypothetical protein
VLGCKACGGAGTTGFYQFLVDGVAPSIGPTNEYGDYIFERYVATFGNVNNPQYASRQGYLTSVLAQVTNTDSNNHTIRVGLGCTDANQAGGCAVETHWTTMRVDVFEP